jgi:2-polyprenyl-6-methoxyphenol hydroxylase-like FAD-dependent oxidoreductase
MNQYGNELASIRYEDGCVTAVFTNGESVVGSIIVGSDGPRSKVREVLLGPEADVTPLEIVHSNVSVTYEDAEKARFVRSAHPVFSFAVRPGVLSFLSSMFPSILQAQVLTFHQFKTFLIQQSQQTGSFKWSQAG